MNPRGGGDLHVVGGIAGVDAIPCLGDGLLMADGYVGGKPVKCMRDNGSTVGVVRASLVKPDEFSGRRKKYVMIDGTMREDDVAVVQLDCPYFRGPFECLVVNSPLCDVVVGNVAGATRCGLGDVGCAVVTRLMASKEGKPTKPLLVPQVGVLQVNVEDPSRMQRESSNLEKCFSWRNLVKPGLLARPEGSLRDETRSADARVYQRIRLRRDSGGGSTAAEKGRVGAEPRCDNVRASWGQQDLGSSIAGRILLARCWCRCDTLCPFV